MSDALPAPPSSSCGPASDGETRHGSVWANSQERRRALDERRRIGIGEGYFIVHSCDFPRDESASGSSPNVARFHDSNCGGPQGIT